MSTSFAGSNNMSYNGHVLQAQQSSDSHFMGMAQHFWQPASTTQSSLGYWGTQHAQQPQHVPAVQSTQFQSENWSSYNLGWQIQQLGKGRSDVLSRISEEVSQAQTPGLCSISSVASGEPTSVLDLPMLSPQSPALEQKQQNLLDCTSFSMLPHESVSSIGGGGKNLTGMKRDAGSMSMGASDSCNWLYSARNYCSSNEGVFGVQEPSVPAFQMPLGSFQNPSYPTSSESLQTSSIFSSPQAATEIASIESWMDTYLDLPCTELTPSAPNKHMRESPISTTSSMGQHFHAQASNPKLSIIPQGYGSSEPAAATSWQPAAEYNHHHHSMPLSTPVSSQVACSTWSPNVTAASSPLFSPSACDVLSASLKRQPEFSQYGRHLQQEARLSLPTVKSLEKANQLGRQRSLTRMGSGKITTPLNLSMDHRWDSGSQQTTAPVPQIMVEVAAASGPLLNLLKECAEEVDAGKETAQEKLTRLQIVSSHIGDPTQRMAAHFCDALKERLNKSRLYANQYSSLATCPLKPETSQEDYMVAYQAIDDATPYPKFTYFTANQVLMEAMEGAEQAHIIDFGILHGLQWAALLQGLGAMTNPPKLRITGIASAELGGSSMSSLVATGKRLSGFASTLGIQFEFCPLNLQSMRLQDLEVADLKTRDRECVVVNFMLQLHHLLGDDPGPLQKLLGVVRRLRPTVVTLAEYDISLNQSLFKTRFNDSIPYYSSLFQSLDERMPRDSPERFKAEKLFLATSIRNVLACEGSERTKRYESSGRWRSIMEATGFTSTPLSSYALSQARLLLWLYSDKYHLTERQGCLSLNWLDQPMLTVSAWRCWSV